MKKTVLMALSAMLSAPLQADFVSNNGPLVTANSYLDIAYADNRIVAVGDRGKILYSDDQGAHWKQAATPSEVLLTSVCFADARHGWAVGHDAVVLASNDGGESWAVQYSDPLGASDGAEPVEEERDDYSMDDLYGNPYSDNAYGDEDDDLYGGDGGAMAPVDTSGAPLLDVFCDSRGRAVAVGGYGYFLKTSDGGKTWNKALDSLDNRDGWHLYDYAAAKGGNDRYVVGEKGVMFHSADKGISWEKLNSPYGGTLFGVTTISDYKALTYGLQGNVWLTANRGRSWVKIPSKLTRGVNDGTVLANGTVVLVTNAGGILTSRDGGQSFSQRFLPGRDSISAVLPRDAGGILVAGQGGLRVIEDVK
ncbi:YCF48-related protein [Alcanivorax sp.]|jgi:photosystem II stability/assembly factor-like uncharacterized protein|uniref:WD40/YVTN/BNR-like repeat-containing protein n=1 Tax=Alcanivorax sp. TaxID=1872427 RepID=UPI0032D8E4DC